jgi:polyisoprenoid-binding protein YceI
MKKINFFARFFAVAALLMFTTYAWAAPQETVAPVADALAAPAAVFPGPGHWEFTFKSATSFISYFLAGNVHDTLGYVRTMQGSASAALDAETRMTAAAVQFTFEAREMNSNDEARDKRMYKKFMEVHIYPEIAFSGKSAGTGLEQSAVLSAATKEQPIAFDLAGTLAIHGVTRDITIPLTAYLENGLLITEGTTTLQLPDFNIKNPSWLFMRTEDLVKIEFHIELQPQPQISISSE